MGFEIVDATGTGDVALWGSSIDDRTFPTLEDLYVHVAAVITQEFTVYAENHKIVFDMRKASAEYARTHLGMCAGSGDMGADCGKTPAARDR